MPRLLFQAILFAGLALFASALAAEAPGVRAPWKLELIAEAPRLKHPSVVACAPDGRVFVAEDPMDITRPADVAEGRILCLHPDGRLTVFAEHLHAVFGMQYLEGKLYVLHNPRFSVFRDDNSVGKDRAELLSQTNPNPWALDWNDHVPANFRLGMDGRFYVATGDKGIFGAVGSDGKRLDLHGGGVFRVRPDGADLETYATGARNILDIAMTDEDEIFTYDNTDENQWMGRVTHMVEGGYYGYPFEFIPQRPHTLWMMADYGAGAATGATVYNADALPPEYRGNLFLADFGQRNIRRVQIERAGATFRAARDELFFLNPPADFRPVGIAFSEDGLNLYVCDWQHRDTKENKAAGRLWKATWTGQNHSAPASTNALQNLAHPSRNIRMNAQRALAREGSSAIPNLKLFLTTNTPSPLASVHAIWALDAIDSGESARAEIIALATNQNPTIARQAIRQLGNRKVESSGPTLRALLRSPDASIRFQAAAALGRIGDWRAAEDLVAASKDDDLFARYAMFHALNRIARESPDAWPPIIRGLKSDNARTREACAFAMRDTFDKELVRMLAAAIRYASADETDFKIACLKALAPLHHEPPAWDGSWWAYHPFRMSPPAKTNEWPGTSVIFETLAAALRETSIPVRIAAAQGLAKFGTDDAGAALLNRYNEEIDPAVQNEILLALENLKYSRAGPLAAQLLREATPATIGRATRFALATRSAEALAALQELAASAAEFTPQIIDALGAFGSADSAPLLARLAEIPPLRRRLAAIRNLPRVGGTNTAPLLIALLSAPEPPIAAAALQALAPMKIRDAIPAILKIAENPALKSKAAAALAEMPDARAVPFYLHGLADKSPALRASSRAALAKIRDDAWPQIAPVFKSLSKQTIANLQRIYRGHAPADAAGLNAIEVDRPPTEAYLSSVAAAKGNRERGEKIFKDRAGVACINCHRVRGEGTDIGPDLSGIGFQFDRRALAESILYPSRAVREGYNVSNLELTDGDELSGMVRAESADSLTLQPATGPARAIPKAQIKTRRATATSLMPEGLEAGLSLEDFADLIAFLESLRSGT